MWFPKCHQNIFDPRDLSRFIDWQSDLLKRNYNLLCEVLEKEMSDPLALSMAMSIKQEKHVHSFFKAYFGSKNETGMEEDENLKTRYPTTGA